MVYQYPYVHKEKKMSAKLLSGKEVSEAMLAKVLEDAQMLKAHNIVPTLAIFRVGEDPGSISYDI